MQLGSSIGLSLFIHIAIIAWHRTTDILWKKNKIRARYETKTAYLGLAIIGFISITILAGALSVVRISITDKHSSIAFIYNYLHDTNLNNFPDGHYMVTPVAEATTETRQKLSLASPTPLAMKTIGARTDSCAQVNTRNTGSLVDYLKAHGLDDSFSARIRLAQRFGIENYTGSFAQNEIVLQQLREDFFGC